MSELQQLASSFGAAAQLYEANRPDYARTAVAWAVATAPGTRVLDLGAGTGKLTGSLVAQGFDVIAVEPDAAMFGQLQRAHPRVQSMSGSAESIPLPDESVDAVVSGNAMHWFDMDRAGPEIARVLRSHGVLAGLWNLMDDEVEWVAGLARAGGLEAIGSRDTPGRWRAATASMHLPRDPAAARFGPAVQEIFPHAQRRTADSLVDTFATKAGLLVMHEAVRNTRLAEIRAYLYGHPATAHGEFDLPMYTGVLRTSKTMIGPVDLSHSRASDRQHRYRQGDQR